MEDSFINISACERVERNRIIGLGTNDFNKSLYHTFHCRRLWNLVDLEQNHGLFKMPIKKLAYCSKVTLILFIRLMNTRARYVSTGMLSHFHLQNKKKSNSNCYCLARHDFVLSFCLFNVCFVFITTSVCVFTMLFFKGRTVLNTKYRMIVCVLLSAFLH